MSISADPQATVDFDVKTINGETIPLKARFLTWRERKRLNDIVNSKIIGKTPDDQCVIEAAEEAIRIGIITPFETLDSLTPRELCTLAASYRVVMDMTEIERGKSSSLLRFTPGKSAQDAPAGAATDPTNKAP